MSKKTLSLLKIFFEDICHGIRPPVEVDVPWQWSGNQVSINRSSIRLLNIVYILYFKSVDSSVKKFDFLCSTTNLYLVHFQDVLVTLTILHLPKTCLLLSYFLRFSILQVNVLVLRNRCWSWSFTRCPGYGIDAKFQFWTCIVY